MEGKNSNRSRIIGLRLTPDEYAKIEKKWKASNHKKLSVYVRNHLLEKPVVTHFRNRSQDDLLVAFSALKQELNAIGNNFNQSVKRLHTLDQIAEFRQWLLRYELEKKTLFNKVDEIKNHIQKLASTWLQS